MNTPRTEGEWLKLIESNVDDHSKRNNYRGIARGMTLFAIQLETELNAANAEIKRLKADCDSYSECEILREIICTKCGLREKPSVDF